MKTGAIVLSSGGLQDIYGSEELADIGRLVKLAAPPLTPDEARARPDLLAGVEVLFSGWGGPRLDAAFLAAAPHLRLLLYGAGSVRKIVTDAMWDRGIRVSTAVSRNAVPVAEYTLAVILLGLKRFWQQERAYRDGAERHPIEIPGAYGATVGLVSLGTIGRLVCERLRPFDVHVIAYDPYARADDARALGVELCPLAEVFRRGDVVSLHAPNLPETQGLVTGALVQSMKPWAVLVNSARGAVVREDELAAALAARPDLHAVLDVTIGESLETDAALLRLANVTRTPHIAGSQGRECRRMGRFMVQELERYLRGESLQGEVTRERAQVMA
jgi:phosphoglycerate dehydrogenase-like enzyme